MTDDCSGADRSLIGWYRQSTPKVRRVFWTCTVGLGPRFDGRVRLPVHDSGDRRRARDHAGPGRQHRQRQLFCRRHRRLDWWLAGRPLWPRPRAAGHHPVVLDLLLPVRLRAELRAAADPAHSAGLRLRRGMGGGCGAARRARHPGPSRQGARRRTERRRARLGDGRPAGGAGGGDVLPRRWAGGSRSSSACCLRCWCSSSARRATTPRSSGGPRRARSNRAAPSCRWRSSDRSCAASPRGPACWPWARRARASR